MMKDRAGVVGASGVGAFLRDALDAFAGHVHLLGHSYGARVMLSAVSIAPLPRPVASMLLLQPAVNHLCFAEDAGEGAPGGYRPALARVAQPILVTHSVKDVPLRRIFHVALRRKRDLGEAQIAGTAPKFGALGGFGPGGQLSVRRLKIAAPPAPYDLTGVEVIALDGSDGAIAGHGDVSNRATWWALHQLVAGA
jgi:pimeloyl-ACP methyl ester carboxylesterase